MPPPSPGSSAGCSPSDHALLRNLTNPRLPPPMNINRRDWLKITGGAALAASLPRSLEAAAAAPGGSFAAPDNIMPLVREFEQPMFNLPGQFSSPVKIESVEMLKNGTNFF